MQTKDKCILQYQFSMLKIMILLTVFLLANQQGKALYPTDYTNIINYQKQPSAFLCYSFCLTCQTTLLGSCNSCQNPYYKTIPPICNVTDSFTLIGWELWQNTVNSGLGGVPGLFNISPYWNTNSNIAKSQYCGPHILYGPFKGSDTLNYSKQLPPHNFIVIKLFYARINWQTSDKVTIMYSLDNTFTRLPINLFYVGNETNSNNPVQLTALCDSNFNPDNTSNDDQMSSFQFKFYDTSTTKFSIQFISNLSNGSAWGINTFFVLVGSCDPTCSTCGFDTASTACLTCRSLLAQAVNGSCSICGAGYYYKNTTGCGLCPINCSRCNNTGNGIFCTQCPSSAFTLDTSKGLCYYSSQSQNYFMAQNELNTEQFTFSLYSVLPSTQNVTISTCGYYSIVGGIGIATTNSVITRTYNVIQPHVLIGIRFNVLKIDKLATQFTNTISVQVDGLLLLNTTLILTGQSNECGGPQLQTYTTASSGYINHSNQKNVVFSFTSDAAIWGIRDVFVSINNCGSNCAFCTTSGCKGCTGFISLVGVSCAGCLPGFTSFNNSCVGCDLTCQTCSLKTGKCLSCGFNFVLVNGTCQYIPELIQVNKIGASSIDPLADPSPWTLTSPTNTTTSYNCTFVDITKINPLSSLSTPLFIVTKNIMSRVYTNLALHYKVRTRFLLMKIDDWGTDYLALYINDLLVMHQQFTDANAGGSDLCGTSQQNQLIAKKDIEIFDSNSTVTISFEAETSTDRYFAIRGFLLLISVCTDCASQSFVYKIEYAISNDVEVSLIFNRPVEGFMYNLTFQDIFQLKLDNTVYNYTLDQYSPNVYVLSFIPNTTIIEKVLEIYCLYPQAVVTMAKSKLYSIYQQTDYENLTPLKFLETSSASVTLYRFDPLVDSNSPKIKSFLTVYVEIALYISLISFLLGWQKLFTHLIHNMQQLFLHMYIANLYLPTNLTVVLEGFINIQNLNFFGTEATQKKIQQAIIPDLVYFKAPAQFTQYFQDIAFARTIYSVFIFFVLIVVLFIIVRIVLNQNAKISNSQNFFAKLYKQLINKWLSFFNSLVYFQYITLCFAIFIQFIDTNITVTPFSQLNLTATTIAFIFATTYPISVLVYIRHQHDNPNFDYLYRDIFDKTYKDKIDFFSSYRSSFYEIFKFGIIYFKCLIIALIYQPFIQLFMLVIFFVAYIVLTVKVFHVKDAQYYSTFIELAAMLGLEAMILVCYCNYRNMDGASYLAMGNIAIFFIIIVVIFSVVRTIATLYHRIKLIVDHPELVNQIDEVEAAESERKLV